MKKLFFKVKNFKMKKEYIAPVIVTAVAVAVLIFSWQYYQKTKGNTAATTPPASGAAKTT